MKLSHKLIMVSAAALMGISPILGSAQGVNAATSTKSAKKTTSSKSSSKSSNSITLTHNAYVYDKNGKRLKTYMGSAKYTTIAKGVTVKSSGTKTINGVLYYSLGSGAYIKAANVAKSSASTTSTTKKTTTSTKTTSITLTKNAYFYNKNGKRVKKYNGMSKLVKGTTVDSYGTKTISGKKYYQLNSKGTVFIKAANVDKKTTSTKTSSSKTTITLKKNAYIYDANGDTEKKGYKKGKTLTATEARYIGTKLYYKIGEDQYIKAANVGKVSGAELEPVNEPDGAATVDTSTTSTDTDTTTVTTTRIAPLYNIKGVADTTREFGVGQTQQVSELRYIATSSTATPELFYKLSSGRGYLKASDVTVNGKTMLSVNTPEEAKADVTVATATDKAKLAQSIAASASVKASDLYKNSEVSLQAAYDAAISAATTVNNSSTATVGQVNEALANINEAQGKLNGVASTTTNTTTTTANN